ncbi:hypothetical protein CRV02_00460 [Arcobacter sp. CECT 8989]|uniref:hypothetical protein n=1 Tax=Arcobacter sp. CECT 8989 TaxID=2044509 RepID=UPI00100AEC46|nr:hypothetical protein [Arcobacter sp. CECT 8989]RXK03703.1 hypothetical protein CRV02_00460 [Arcobacter sp. CECT 8989]
MFKNSICENLSEKIDETNLLLKELIYEIKETSTANEKSMDFNVDLMLTRFFNLFELHGIHINEIPIVIEKKFNITYYDISSKKNLLNKISNELLDWLACFFSVNINWLLGKDEYMYKIHHFDKDILGFCKMLNSISKEYDDYDIHFIKDFEFDVNVNNNESRQHIYPICEIKLLELNGKNIYKYIVFEDYYWNYNRTRFELKALIYLIYKSYVDYYRSKIYIKGRSLEENIDYYDFIRGKLSYEEVISFGYTWYPDDYVDDPLESSVAKDSEERKEVLNYIDEWQLIKYITEELEYFSTNSKLQKNESKDISLHEIDKKPEQIVLFVEGETDKLHLEKAYNVLYKKAHSFNIIPFNGVVKLERSLLNFPKEVNNHISTNPIIAIFDADNTGIKSFNKVVKKRIDNNIGIIKSLDNHYAILLPLPYKDLEGLCEIEYLYSKEFLDKYGILEYRENKKIVELIGNDKTELSKVFRKIELNEKLEKLKYYKINENLKKEFAEKIFNDSNLDESVFESFRPLFELIERVLKI